MKTKIQKKVISEYEFILKKTFMGRVLITDRGGMIPAKHEFCTPQNDGIEFSNLFNILKDEDLIKLTIIKKRVE